MMMMNMFSIFDPSLSLIFSSWFIVGFICFFFFSFFWLINSIGYFYHKVLIFWFKEVNQMLGGSSPKGSVLMIVSIFVFILYCNFLCLFPHIFSFSSHLSVCLPLSYMFWLGIIFFSVSSSFFRFLVHLIPSGTPVGLMSFMVLVEIMSNIVRPLALAFRLTANMMAGHLLMSLMGGGLLMLSSVFGFVVGMFLQSLLVLMELGVCFIQAYVFSVLLLLYFSETC
uniref:ATP synthase subunit a n=1 Tax=Myocoptes musculinus TaxID=1046713 RepID=A0A0Y0AVL2_9ACAR|nr:ATP synthase F0 subunit 6 [Myocoptes musculinus]